MDSIVVHNLTQLCDTVLYWPDTSLNFLSVNIQEINSDLNGLKIFQNSPNPFCNRTSIKVYTPGQSSLNLYVSDLFGRNVCEIRQDVNRGFQEFTFISGRSNIYIVTAEWLGLKKSIKIVSLGGNSDGNFAISYNGYEEYNKMESQPKSGNLFSVALGDVLKFAGYKDSVVAVVKSVLFGSKDYQLSFGIYPPCPGIPEILYSGNKYFTVQIGAQCWMQESLNYGTMVNSINTGVSHSECSNNSIVEKYCYDNNPLNCDLYGAFYDWDEMMMYQATPGVTGICPSGFHLPTDNDLTDLVNYLGGDWVAGGNIKEAGTGNWLNPNTDATNESGFTAIPSGYRTNNGSFLSQQYYSYIWSSSEIGTGNAGFRYIYYNNAIVYQSNDSKKYGYSVRCIKD